MRLLIIFIFLLTNSFADEAPNIKNLVINKELKKYDSLTFLDTKNAQFDLNNYKEGIYTVKLSYEDRISTKSIVLQ